MTKVEYEMACQEIYEWIMATEEGMIEKTKTIDNIEYYGTNNILMVRFLIRRGSVPDFIDTEDGKHIYYFKAIEDFNNIKPFYKKNGNWIFTSMVSR